MLCWALTFLIVAIIAAVFGFMGIAEAADAIGEAPHGEEVFENFSPIGILKEE
jgi:hypothetical protein